MAEEIRRSDIGQEDLFKDIKESADDARKALQKFDKEVVELSNDIEKKLHKSNKKTLSGINDLTQAQKKASKTFEREVKTKKQLSTVEEGYAKLQKQKKKLLADETLNQTRLSKSVEKLRQERNKEKKALRDSIKQTERNKNAYTKLSDESRDLKNESKRLGAELLQLEANGGKNTKEFRKLEKQYEDTTQQARKTDAQLKDLDKTVGDNFRNVGNYESATDKLTGSLKNLAGAIGIGAAVNGLKNFAMEASRAENQARTFFDTNEEGTKEIAKQANITAKVYGKEVNEVLKSANALSKQFGLTGQQSMAMLNKGFEKGGDVSGDLLSNIQEYSTNLKLAGLNAEKSISIITQSQKEGVFSDKGVDAVHEATLALREMPKVTAEALDALDMSAEDVQKSIADGSKTYFDVIQEISTKLNDLGEDAPETGLAMADIFKGAGEEAGDFILKLGDLNIDLDQMEGQNQGLQDAVQNLTKSWNEFLYGLKEGTGAMGAFSEVINFVANNLSTIIKTLGRLAALYLIIKARQKILNSGMLDYAKNLFKAKKAQSGLNKSMSGSAKGAKKFGKALKSIGFSVLIGVVIELAVAFYDVASGAREARREAAELDAYKKSAEKDANERISERNKQLNLEIRALERKKDLAISEAKSEKKRSKIQSEFLEKRLKLIEDNSSAIQSDIDAVSERQQKYKTFQKQLKEELDIWNDLKEAGKRSEAGEQMVKVSNLAADLGEELGLTSEAWLGLIEQSATWTEVESNLNARIQATNDKLKIYNGELVDSRENIKDVSTAVEVDSNKRENNRGKINAQVKGLEDQNEELEKQKIKLEELNESGADERAENLDWWLNYQRDRLNRSYTERETALINQLEAEEITKEEYNAKMLQLELERLEEERELLILYGKRTTKIDKEIAQKKLEIKQNGDKDEVQSEKEKGEELLKTAAELQEALTDVYVDSVDRRIEKLQEEQDAAKAQQDYLQELAASGQIDAQQSILATQRQQEELEREQRKLEKRKAQIQLISGGLTSYASAIEQGKSPAEALTSTIANTQLLVNGLKSIQAFKSGSEDVGNGGKMDEHGGFLAMLHPKERVMTAEQNAKVSGIPNPLLAEIGHKFKSGELTEKGGQVGYDMGAVVNRLESLENTIKNKPEHYVNFESIAGKMYLNHTKKAGKTTIHNKYKVN